MRPIPQIISEPLCGKQLPEQRVVYQAGHHLIGHVVAHPVVHREQSVELGRRMRRRDAGAAP